MKKRLVVIILLLSIISLPSKVNATTLKEYEDLVAKYTTELKEKEAKIAKGKEEIEQVKKNINKITTQISQTETDIKKLEQEIEKNNQEIINKKNESKKVMEYYQIENGDNIYLEYAFGAESITDMIYRMSIVEQLTEYNDNIMKDLKKLVEENKKKKTSLEAKEVELANLKKKLESEKSRIEAEVSGVEGTVPSTKGQIDLYQKRVTYYKNKGCKSNDIIGVTCDVPKKVVPPSNSGSSSGGSSSSGSVPAGPIISGGYRYPVDGGRISCGYGQYCVGHIHKGVDIIKGCGAPIHPIAAGRVYYVGHTLDTYGAEMVIIVHNINGRLVFSQYAHVQRNVPVSVGQDVDINSTIAYMGTTGWSTGCHLHIEVSEDKGWGYNAKYNEYTRHIINPFKYMPRP